MGYVVRMPQLGMTMEEGVVVEWRTDANEPFEEGDVIVIVESEKTTNEIAAREAGAVVERFVDLEQPVGPGDPIAYVGESGADVPEEVHEEVEGALSGAEDATSDGPETDTDEGTAVSAERAVSIDADRRVSPRARSYAADNGVDVDAIASLEGSGPGGAVVEADVMEAERAGTIGEPERARSEDGLPSVDVAPVERGVYEERSGSQLRQAVSRQMTASAREAPQVTLNRTASVEALLDLKSRFDADLGVSLSLTDFLLKALVNALERHPEFNAIYEDGVHKLAANVNVGIAVDVDGGLMTPVIHGADGLSLAEIAAARQQVVSAVQERTHTADDLNGGTITVTNLGHFGIDSFDPLLNVPEVGILGVGSVQRVPDPEADGGVERHLGLSLTFDHRANDGADAARFLETIADELTHPLRLLDVGTGNGGSGVERGRAAKPEPFVETAALEGKRTAEAASAGGMQADVRSRSFGWTADEPEERGGEDTAPTPVEQFLGSLASCLTLMIGNVADRRGVDVRAVDVVTDAEPADGAIERIDVDVTVVSDEERADVERVVETAERACFVNRVIDDEVEGVVDVAIETP